jgi:hypothetical protein
VVTPFGGNGKSFFFRHAWRSGLFVFIPNFLRMNQGHRSASSSRQTRPVPVEVDLTQQILMSALPFNNGHSPKGRVGQLCADIVAKVFLGWRTKILRAADAFYAWRREGPYRFIQNRSRTSVVALKANAAAEKSKDQLSRDF